MTCHRRARRLVRPPARLPDPCSLAAPVVLLLPRVPAKHPRLGDIGGQRDSRAGPCCTLLDALHVRCVTAAWWPSSIVCVLSYHNLIRLPQLSHHLVAVVQAAQVKKNWRADELADDILAPHVVDFDPHVFDLAIDRVLETLALDSE